MQPAASRPTRAVCKTVLEGQLRNVLFMHECRMHLPLEGFRSLCSTLALLCVYCDLSASAQTARPTATHYTAFYTIALTKTRASQLRALRKLIQNVRSCIADCKNNEVIAQAQVQCLSNLISLTMRFASIRSSKAPGIFFMATCNVKSEKGAKNSLRNGSQNGSLSGSTGFDAVSACSW
eukprot:14284-Heterococcus_DN1.PRE.4